METDEDLEQIDIENDISMDFVANSNGTTINGVTSMDAITGTTASAVATTQPTVTPDAIKRRAILQIRNDATLDERTKRFKMQELMDGSSRSRNNHRRASATAMNAVLGGSVICPTVPGAVSSRRASSSSDWDSSGISSVNSNSTNGNSSSRSAAGRPLQFEVMKCVHYEERKCLIVAPCCNGVFGCRICHDEMVTDGHEINRFDIRRIICKECHTPQERSNECINPNCQVTFGEYHCNTCNLWMNETKKPFHCEKCGICRVGGQENFIHCDECNMCIRGSTFENHRCLKDKFKNSCPVCMEDMHSSRHTSLDLACGHAIHQHCFRKMASFEYRCPICKKTLLNPETMARAWQERANDIARQPMPPDLAKVVDIGCYDCGAKSKNRDWHFLGVQCPQCNSFNTTVENNSST